MGKLLVVGGAGHVGRLVVPELARHHDVTVLDLKDPSVPGVRWHSGSVLDPEVLAEAVPGHDVLVWMAMGPNDRGDGMEAKGQFDINVTALHLTLAAAGEAGVRKVVQTSSMSVYDSVERTHRGPDSDAEPCDATHFYGLSKYCGEVVGEAAARQYRMAVTALRLCLPTSGEEWGRAQAIATSARDTADAYLRAIDHVDGAAPGFEAMAICGNPELINVERARDVLGWEPRDRPGREAIS